MNNLYGWEETLQLLSLPNPKSNSSLSWLVCKMCMCSSCLFVDLKIIERGGKWGLWQNEGKRQGTTCCC
jgi:hypothetical protein